MTSLQGLIPAAGKGVRARPYTHEVHKGMLQINGVPNIQRVVEVMRDQLAIRRIVIVVGYLGETIKAHFGDGENFDVEIEYVDNDQLEKGLAWSISLAQEKITAQYFCIMLCDECYISSNHYKLLRYPYQDKLVTCCGLPVDEDKVIRRNYAICLDAKGDIKELQEKPVIVSSRIMGTGTFLCSKEIFGRINDFFLKSSDGYVEFVHALNEIQQNERSLGYFQIDGTYVNINDRDSLYLAKYHERKRVFLGSSVGLIIHSDGTEDNVCLTIQRYADLGLFKEIYVVLPFVNSIAHKVKESEGHAIVCPESISGYGEMLKYATKYSSEDIIVFTEAIYSFPARDVEKLMTYLPEADMVIGTRTTRQLIEQGSNMRGPVRMAHAVLGRVVEIFWWDRQARFTDVGCTFRAIWKSSFDSIAGDLHSRGPEFSVEMMIALLNQHQRVIEVPVSYFNQGQFVGRKYQTATTFFRFLALILMRSVSKRRGTRSKENLAETPLIDRQGDG